ncbi:MAG: hypothetical protein ACKVS9_01850 [Phycisphaerae bacterium]
MRVSGVLFTALLIASIGAAPLLAQADEARMKLLIEQILKGDEVESKEATQRLADQVTATLAKSLGTIEYDKLTMPQAIRLKVALEAISSQLRARTFRATLPTADRELFDRFEKEYPDLTVRLFHDSEFVRRTALEQIPLDPGGGAGIMIAARIDDATEDVMDAAIELAGKFKDPVLTRRIAFIIRDYTNAIRGGYYDVGQQDLARTIAIFVGEMVKVLIAHDAREHAATVAEVTAYFGRGKLWDEHETAEIIRALGAWDAPPVVDLLLGMLDDPRLADFRVPGPAQKISQTVGDAALLALLSVHKLKAEDYGFVTDSERGMTGFPDDKSRIDARRAFRAWHEKNRPRAASQPASATATQPKESSKP